MIAIKNRSMNANSIVSENIISSKRVLFTGDIIRTGFNGNEPNQNINIEWLHALLSAPIKWASEKPAAMLRSRPEDGFDICHFYNLCDYGLKPNSRNWAVLFDAPAIREDAAKYIAAHLQDSIVIGLEIPKIFCKLMTVMSVPFIDITFHPVRYGQEIMLGMRSNVRSVYDRMVEFSVQEDEHYIEAALYAAKRQAIPFDMRRGVLIGGQTLGDRVSIHNGRFISLIDYRDQLAKVLLNTDVAYYKRHPLVRNDHDAIRFMASFQNVKFIENNIYDLLSSGIISEVHSLCSGISVEAKYFGVNGYMFHKPMNRFLELDDVLPNDDFSEIFVTIKDWSLNGLWWKYVLGFSEVPPTHRRTYSSSAPIRETLKQDWGRRKG